MMPRLGVGKRTYVETEEEEFGMLVQEAEGGEGVPAMPIVLALLMCS